MARRGGLDRCLLVFRSVSSSFSSFLQGLIGHIRVSRGEFGRKGAAAGQGRSTPRPEEAGRVRGGGNGCSIGAGGVSPLRAAFGVFAAVARGDQHGGERSAPATAKPAADEERQVKALGQRRHGRAVDAACGNRLWVRLVGDGREDREPRARRRPAGRCWPGRRPGPPRVASVPVTAAIVTDMTNAGPNPAPARQRRAEDVRGERCRLSAVLARTTAGRPKRQAVCLA